MHVDDLARGVVTCLEKYDDYSPINCGAGSEISIGGIAETIGRVVGFEGKIAFDPSKPDGVARKLMDSSRLRALGWRPEIELEEGLAATYQWALENKPQGFSDAQSPSISSDHGFHWEM